MNLQCFDIIGAIDEVVEQRLEFLSDVSTIDSFAPGYSTKRDACFKIHDKLKAEVSPEIWALINQYEDSKAEIHAIFEKVLYTCGMTDGIKMINSLQGGIKLGFQAMQSSRQEHNVIALTEDKTLKQADTHEGVKKN